MGCHVRPMTREDVPQVTEIDREAFPTQAPPASYAHELDNRLARYLVANCDEITGEKAPEKNNGSLGARLKRLFDGNGPVNSREYLLGFAGFWIMADEAHVTSIAVREKQRGCGLGELLLASLIDLAVQLRAGLVTLEVRASNITAQNLYIKYGFQNVGMRPGYYTDNGEDAILMTLDNIAAPEVQAKLRELKQAHAARWGAAECMLGAPAKAQPGK